MDLKRQLAQAFSNEDAPAADLVQRPRDEAAWESSKQRMREFVLSEVAPNLSHLNDEQKRVEVTQAVALALDRQEVAVSPRQQASFMNEVLSDILGYGPLDDLLADDEVTEIMCNAHDEIWFERNGVLEESQLHFANETHFRRVIDRLVREVDRRIDESSPMVDARMKEGGRLNAVIPPVAVHSAALTIRKAPRNPLEVSDLLGSSNWTTNLVLFFEACVASRVSILVSGGTGSGKTTVLGLLTRFIPTNERLITIEDAVELVCHQPNWVALEARPSNAENAGLITIRDLVRNALRMRPNRIIVGEVRGGEALDMLQAMNTGHEGSMTTLHANSARDALNRLETLSLLAGVDLPLKAVKEQIGSAIDLIVHLERLPNGRRVVQSVTEVQGVEGDSYTLADIFVAERGPNANAFLRASGVRPLLAQRLEAEGHPVPTSIFRES